MRGMAITEPEEITRLEWGAQLLSIPMSDFFICCIGAVKKWLLAVAFDSNKLAQVSIWT